MRHVILEYCFSGARQVEGKGDDEEERGGMDKFIEVVCLFCFFFDIGTFQVHLFVLTHFFVDCLIICNESHTSQRGFCYLYSYPLSHVAQH